ncbi:hypothetical protein TRFO_18464 [Tritrichomonas foetus]|uniref:Uncharacterized protein n=1 Tax=Tritrichomonas foetus TaxID=1144522 RepID=A0A1J4KKY8_9EUKA|nr:hypothetical protein TRFO_18464 [Tritrichomonas foetus]|eukprot:OHT11891.1 hypothetical protein TRFO_18464 [Tritrichomonas foetus]
MSANLLQSLRPSKISPEIVQSALSTWKKHVPESKLTYLEYGQKRQQAKTLCFVYTLISTPNFMDYVANMKQFATADDLQFGPELCGQDIFDKYLHDTNFASRFLCMVNQIKGTEKKSANFLQSLIEEDSNHAYISNFLKSMIQFIDNANCWPYLPLPQKVPPFLFANQNPLRQLFCSRKLNSVEPFLHLYTPVAGKTLQSIILDADPILDAPNAICFAVDEPNGYKMTVKDLQNTLALPLAVERSVFEQTCERCYSWEKSDAPKDAKDKVLNAYHDAIILETYKLSGFVAVDNDENYFVALLDNQTKLKSKSSLADDVSVLSAIYTRVI